MSEKYLPLYRKYRPQNFNDLIGQESVSKALSNAINMDKISHAYLFCGPRGTGKTSSARIFAKSLNCLQGPTVTPCEKCASCIDITHSTPVDVIEIDAASNRSVEDTQKILEKIQYVPVQGKFKIYIIDEVHMLSTTAFNSLLKTLEEPPANVIFILATTEAHKVLETIISRCQRFDFRRITTEDIARNLENIAQKENIQITKEAIFAIAKNSQGGMRDALALLDQISVYSINKEITIDDIDKMLGKLSVDKLFELAQNFVNKTVQNSLELINKVYDDGAEPLQIVGNLISYFRNLLIIKSSTDKALIVNLTQLNENNIEKMAPQASNLATHDILHLIDRLSYYAKQVKDSSNRHLWLELCVIELSSPVMMNKPEAIVKPELKQALNVNIPVIKEIESTKEILIPKESLALPKESAQEEIKTTLQAPVKEPEPTVETIETAAPRVEQTENTDLSWESILTNVKSIPAKMFFNGLATPVELTSDRIKLSFTNENLATQAKADMKFRFLKEACILLSGNEDILIEIAVGKVYEVPPLEVLNAPTPLPESPNIVKKDTVNEAVIPDVITVEEPVIDKGYEMQTPTQTSPSVKIEHTDQVRMVQDLFNGKIMD